MNAPPPRGGKPAKAKNRNNNRRHRNRQNRNNKGRRSQNPHRRGPPQSPQIKITLRNIGNVERYGTVEAIADCIIRPLLEQTNERLLGAAISTTTGGPKMILLEEESLIKLITNDKLATQARKEWKNKQSDAGGKGEDEEDTAMPDVDVAESNMVTTEEDSNNKNNAEETIVSGMKDLDMNKDKNEKIHARTLYVVPPKQTRRRGEKPGNVYLVLTTPPIPAAAIEQPPPSIEEVPLVNAEGETKDNNHNNDTQTEEEKTAKVVPPLVSPPKVDYSRQIAERQLALVRALEIMTAIAVEDGKGDQAWAGCQVEESSNGKSWRPPQRKDHREGTVQESPGFKSFMEMAAKEKKDLQARPKPAPGGGLSALSTGLAGTGDSTTDNNGKPVAALVLHLQSKREQEKSQKKNKRKAKDAKKKTGGSNENNNGKTTADAGAAAGAKRRGRQRKNKKGATAKKAADPKS
uniref:Uncharacterized protein n=1 Tax=Amphora coffeiformis TaxID=265554 RepID=A0A7S3P4J0_9STRA